ncbi:MAG: polyketide synthase [Bacteroidota bacterium]
MSDIAIIAMSCRFPDSGNPLEFWKNLERGKVHFRSIPPERREQSDFSNITVDKGSFIRDPYLFDNQYFNISEEEAMAMDPQQRIILELAVEARDSAGLENFPNNNIGVYIGANHRAYGDGINAGFYRRRILDLVRETPSFQKIDQNIQSDIIRELAAIEALPDFHSSLITGNLINMIAGRLSHEFNLNGPSLTMDTACSSSLVAVHMACEAIKKGECDLAFAGGTNLNLSPAIFREMEHAMVISRLGTSIPFSEYSDGILLGEGAGLILLKRLDEAICDGDRVLAVIKGSGVNNDGKTISIMAPSWRGQLSLLETVYKNSNYDRSKISYIEAHGTSTRLGDSVEITVLKQFFNHSSHSVSIGSVKSNIGHLLGSSGIAGLIKAILSIQNRKLVPSPHDQKVNPKWKLDETGLAVQNRLEEWSPDGVRAVGINSFGFGGTNAHIILEEFDQDSTVSYREPIRTSFSRKSFNYDLFPGCNAHSRPASGHPPFHNT